MKPAQSAYWLPKTQPTHRPARWWYVGWVIYANRATFAQAFRRYNTARSDVLYYLVIKSTFQNSDAFRKMDTTMADFVAQGSIVRTIWGNADTIMLVFAGSAAEFALNRAVDWLFFTNKLPRDPIGRLFSTARFAQDIVFVDEATVQQTFDRITAIHRAVEGQRGMTMPDWAHRDVLYMLMDYSSRAFELVHRPLTLIEQRDNFAVFRRVGLGLHIPDLPATYEEWLIDRQQHLERDLVYSSHTAALYRQYRQHLGAWRYDLLLQTQALLVPAHVRALLHLNPRPRLARNLWLYPLMQRLRLRSLVQRVLMPPRYLDAARQLDRSIAA